MYRIHKYLQYRAMRREMDDRFAEIRENVDFPIWPKGAKLVSMPRRPGPGK